MSIKENNSSQSKIKDILLKLFYWSIDLKKHIKYLFSDVEVRISGIDKTSRQIAQSYKNKYKGMRCFIIGNGPSLTTKDLEMLNNEITFASNSIYRIAELTQWRPTFYGAFDEVEADSQEKIFGINHLECKVKFFRQQGFYVFKKMTGKCCYLSTKHRKVYLDHPGFSKDISKNIYTIGTVIYALIQIAVYMGFTDIFLIGVDHKFARERTKDGKVIENKESKSYFYKSIEEIGAASVWQHKVAFEYAEQFSRKNGIRIYNATRGGNLEVFERVDIDTLLKIRKYCGSQQ